MKEEKGSSHSQPVFAPKSATRQEAPSAAIARQVFDEEVRGILFELAKPEGRDEWNAVDAATACIVEAANLANRELTDALSKSLAMLAAIMKMSDHAESLGGARCLSGVAALHTLQTSLQKNGPRMAALARTLQRSSPSMTGPSGSAQGNSGRNP